MDPGMEKKSFRERLFDWKEEISDYYPEPAGGYSEKNPILEFHYGDMLHFHGIWSYGIYIALIPTGFIPALFRSARQVDSKNGKSQYSIRIGVNLWKISTW